MLIIVTLPFLPLPQPAASSSQTEDGFGSMREYPRHHNLNSGLQHLPQSVHMSKVQALGGSMSQAVGRMPGGGAKTSDESPYNKSSPPINSQASFHQSAQQNGGGGYDSHSPTMPRAPQVPKENRQAAIKQWLSYERKAVAAGLRPPRKAPMQERSMLSQINPGDHEQGCLRSFLAAFRIGNKAVYLPPQAGEDVCGLCLDNKPLLQQQPCGHRTCLLCAKSLCYLLDLQQLVLCPYCGSLVTSFGLA